MELTASMPELSRISIFFVSLTIHIDGLTRDAVFLRQMSERLSESETSLDFLYLLRRERRLPTALIVGVPLSRQEDAFSLSLSYHLSLKLSDRSEDFEIQVLCRIGLVAVELHSFLDELDAYFSGEQVLDDIEEVTQGTGEAVYAVDIERVSISEVFQAGSELRSVCILAGTFVLKDLIQSYASQLTVCMLFHG